MNRSSPLSADARRLLELGSHVEPPTAEQDERMDRALAPLFRTARPGPAAGSALGAAEQPSTSPPKEAASGIGKPGGTGELSGIRLRAAPRARPRFLDPLHGLRDAKLWLTLGALAATASASFWLGRLSTPAEGAEGLEAQRDGRVSVSSSLETSRFESDSSESDSFERHSSESSRAALGVGALAPLESGIAPPAGPSLASAAVASPLLDPASASPSSATTPLASIPDAPNDGSAPRAAGTRAPNPAALARDKPGQRRLDRRSLRSSGLAAEIEQLARAEAALRQGRAEHALAVLEQRSVQHLLEQAAALRAIAQCELGVAAAATSAREVLERWPASAFQARIARACGR